MKQVAGIKEAAQILAEKLYKVQVNLDGEPAYKGHFKTNEIRQNYGSITRFLETLIEESNAQEVAVHYGESNGSSWKNPRWIYFKKAADVAQPMDNIEVDPYSLNGIEVNHNAKEALQARLWMVKNELDRTKSERDRFDAKLQTISDKYDVLEEKYRDLKHEHKDLELDHQRQISNMTKPSYFDKILENEDLMDKIGEAIGENLRPSGLNGADLSPEGQYVLEAMRSTNGMDKAFARVVAQLTNIKFLDDLNSLLTKHESTQEPGTLDLTADQ